MNMIDPGQDTTKEMEESKWFGDLIPVICSQCNQSYLIDPGLMDNICPVCLQKGFEENPNLAYKNEPELVLPSKISRANLNVFLSPFLEKFRFQPDDLSISNLETRALFHYWTMWLLDASVDGHWKADIGFD